MRNWFDRKAFEFNYNLQRYTFALATVPTVPRNLQFKQKNGSIIFKDGQKEMCLKGDMWINFGRLRRVLMVIYCGLL